MFFQALLLPDGAVGGVRVQSRHPADTGSHVDRLRDGHLGEVGGKHGGLVHVLHQQTDGGPVAERTQRHKARVHVAVGHLHRQGVAGPGLVVQNLGGRERGREGRKGGRGGRERGREGRKGGRGGEMREDVYI